MKKRICSLLLMVCLLICSCVTFVGCDLLHDNGKRYYAEVVATVGNENITRNEVLTMFNYYYYTQNYYYYGYSEDDVYEQVMQALIKNKILYIEAKKIDSLALTDEDEARIWDEVFTYVSEEIDKYEDEIRTLLDAPARETETDDTTEYVVFESYTRTTPGESDEDAITIKTKAQYLTDLETETNKTTNYYRYLAYKKYLAELKRSVEMYEEAGTTAEVFDDELERLYQYYMESRYVTKYTNYCKQKINITEDKIIQKYNELLNAQKQSFVVGTNYDKLTVSTENKDLILYHSNGNYYTVQQILLQFSDLTEYTVNNVKIKASEYLYGLDNFIQSYDSETELDQSFVDEYLAERNNYAYNDEDSLNMDYINPTTGHTNEDNDGVEKKYTRAEFDALIDDLTTRYNNGELTDREYAQEFFKLKFSFSKDGGVTDLTNYLNLTGYTLNVDESVSNGFVTEFADACYEVYDNYVSTGKYTIAEVVSSYGIHYILFTGVYESGEVSLDSKRSMVTDQTVRDYIYELLLTEAEENCSSEISASLYNQYDTSGLIKIKFEKYEDVQ